MGIDYGQVNDEIDDFADRIRESGELVIDSCAAWDEYAQPLQGDAYLDGVHPTAEGYAFMADTVLAWLEEHAVELGLK